MKLREKLNNFALFKKSRRAFKNQIDNYKRTLLFDISKLYVFYFIFLMCYIGILSLKSVYFRFICQMPD